MLWALNRFKMILFWGLKEFPLRPEIPALKDHLSYRIKDEALNQYWQVYGGDEQSYDGSDRQV